jgi:hypothetical protein
MHFSQEIVTRVLNTIKWVFMALFGFIRSIKMGKSGMKNKGDNFHNRINSVFFQHFKGEEMRKTVTFVELPNILGKEIILLDIF